MDDLEAAKPTTDEERAYNRGWQDGNASALDACKPIIERLQTALRVAAHEPHDQAGEPTEGFPVCSVCGAIQTVAARLAPGIDVERLARAFVKVGVELAEGTTPDEARKLIEALAAAYDGMGDA